MDFLAQLDEERKAQDLLDSLVKKKIRLQQQLQTLESELNEEGALMDTTEIQQSPVQQLTQTLDAYKFLGVSVDPKDEDLVLRFDPLYRNQGPSTDFYLVQIKTSNDRHSVGQHNLPPFVPVQQLEEQYLADGNKKEFVEQIQKHLYAYVQRQEGFKHIKAEYEGKGILNVTVDLPITYTCVTLSMAPDLPDITVTMNYDLCKMSPDSVEIQYDNSVEVTTKKRAKLDRQMARWKTQLIQQDIYTAFTNLLKDSV